MAKSVNSCAVKMTDQIGADTVKYYAQKLGINSKLQAVASIGLGTFDVSLYEMISAYCPFANGGLKTEPIIVWKIEDSKGHVLHEFSQNSDREQVISEESSFLMRFMLQGGMQEQGGTSQNLWSWPGLFPNYNAEYGGKTGTTSNYSDGWYMGMTRDLITGVWVGGDDRSIHFKTGAYGEGSKTALPIFGRYMTKVFADKDLGYKPGPFPKPGFKITKEYLACSNTGGYSGRSRADTLSAGSDSVFFVNPDVLPDAPVPADTTGNN
jgi:penicillin-binding protein 1A